VALLTVVVPLAPAPFLRASTLPLAKERLPLTVAPSSVPPPDEGRNAALATVPPEIVPPDIVNTLPAGSEKLAAALFRMPVS